MPLDKNNFYETIDTFITLPEKVTSVSEEIFRKAYSPENTGKLKNIVYIWRCERNIGRLKGESNILYIGQTKHSFSKRYYPYANLHATSEANKLKFVHIIEKYGSISISISDFSTYGKTLLQAEGQLLWWYFQNHCEYPPINYTKTKIRNSVVNV
jgi:hypothetical protein